MKNVEIAVYGTWVWCALEMVGVIGTNVHEYLGRIMILGAPLYMKFFPKDKKTKQEMFNKMLSVMSDEIRKLGQVEEAIMDTDAFIHDRIDNLQKEIDSNIKKLQVRTACDKCIPGDCLLCGADRDTILSCVDQMSHWWQCMVCGKDYDRGHTPDLGGVPADLGGESGSESSGSESWAYTLTNKSGTATESGIQWGLNGSYTPESASKSATESGGHGGYTPARGAFSRHGQVLRRRGRSRTKKPRTDRSRSRDREMSDDEWGVLPLGDTDAQRACEHDFITHVVGMYDKCKKCTKCDYELW